MAQYIKIMELNNNIEAQLMSSILDERNIPHHIRSYHDSAYDGIFQAQLGWGYLEAPEEYREEIEKIYNDLGKNEDEAGGLT